MRDETIPIHALKNLNKQKTIKIFFHLSLIIILLCSTLSASIVIKETKNRSSYIIEFFSPSLIQRIISHSNKLCRSSFLSERISEKLQNISVFQQNAVNQILSLSDMKSSEHKMIPYQLMFNGLYISNLSKSAIQRIRQLSFVKKIVKDELIIQHHQEIIKNDNKDYNINDNNQHRFFLSETINISSCSGNNVSIAFFDTGIDYTHDAFSTCYKGGYDFVNNDSDPFDDQGHGTHVTGITASKRIKINNDKYFSGIAPNASIYAYKVLDTNGEGYMSWFLSAFEHAMDPNQDGNLSDHIDIISISAGDPEGSTSDLLSNAAMQAIQAGITVVAAAGNKGPAMNTISSPAIAKDVIAVGASIQNTQIAPFSSRGSIHQSTIKPDIIAPGYHILSTWPDDEFKTLSGTSMATPYITGIIACILEKKPELMPLQIQSILHSHAITLGYNETTQGYGIINNTASYDLTPPPFIDMNVYHQTQSQKLLIYLNITHFQSSIQSNLSIYPIDDLENKNSLRSYQQINNTTCMIQLDIEKLTTDHFIIKLILYNNSSFTCLKQIIYLQIDNQQLFYCPQTVSVNEEFICRLTTKNLSFPAIHLFFVPFSTFQIRFGSTVTFKAPRLSFIQKETITGRILTMIPTIPPRFEKNLVTIQNM